MPYFRNIPQMTRANYSVDVSWDYIENWISAQTDINLDMDPEYQRGYVWTTAQKVAYLEYILKGGISGKDIYWNCPGWRGDWRGPLELVDGKQRLGAVLDFLHDRIPVFGCFYSKFQDRMDMIVTKFKFHVHNLSNRADVVQWYLDMNTGGSAHTEKDLEPARSLLSKLKMESSKAK